MGRDPGRLAPKTWAPSLGLSQICLGQRARRSHEPARVREVSRQADPAHTTMSPSPPNEGGALLARNPISQVGPCFCHLLAL